MRKNLCLLGFVSLIALGAISAFAVVPPQDGSLLKSRPAWVEAPELAAGPSLDYMEPGNPRADKVPGVARFFDEASKDWVVSVDTRSNRPNLIQAQGGVGRGLPWIPGAANDLQWESVSFKASARLVNDVADMAREFMGRHPEFFAVDQADLVLDESQSGAFGKQGQLLFVTFQQTYEGIPVQDAIVFFRLNGGNLVSFGTDRLADIRNLNTRANVDQDEALQRVLDHAGFAADEVTELLADGDLKIVPTLPPGESAGHAYAGAPGLGYRHALVREVSFRREGDDTTYDALVDAKNGKILKLVDANRYATVKGAVVQTYGSSDGPVVTFPTNTTTTSGPCTALNGVNFRMLDNCGSINVCDSNDASSGNGIVDMGSSSGHDCSTPGFGGAGNTRSSRSGFYHLTSIRNIADSYYPTNTWLDSKVTANMNINNTCNAYWSGSTVNFYRSGGGCGNTGEIPAVFLHEWGHGFDQNTGGAASDAASGEAVGDTFAALYEQDSCIGPGFLSSTCYNCTTCTGVRDLEDFSYYGTKLRATPANITNNSGINCDRWACPYTGYAGPMGYEGHCESIIAGSAVWNLTQDIGFSATQDLWYSSLTPSKSAFRVASGGQCNTSATVDGCGSTNWYTVFQDVDTGSHACQIWDAFNAQGISCGSRPSCGGGAVCGNNTKETGETCDGTDLGGETCVSQGFSGGTLACNGSCSGFDTSGCTGGGGGSTLQNGVPVTGLSATTGNSLNYTMSVPAGATNLVFTTTGSDPDADLYVKFGSAPTLSSYDCRSWTSSSNETCNIGTAQAGTYYVMVYAYSSFTGLALEGDYTEPGGSCTPYSDSLSGISGSSGSWHYYTQDVAACATTMTIKISGGSGDADLYVRRNADPTTSQWECRPYLYGNNETCTFNPPDTSAIYHIGIRGYTSYSGVLLEVSYQ